MSDSELTDDSINHEINMFWWLHLPILFYVFRYVAHFFGTAKKGIESYLQHELGIIENLTVIFLLFALVCTMSIIVRFGKSLHLFLKIFLVLYCLGCIYFAGEEASWGQHWFGWETSEFFLEHNDQKETNIHNTSEWFDRHPKGVVSLLVFVGGVFIPLLFYYKAWRVHHTRRFWWLWPTWVCLPTAVITTISTWPSKIEDWFGLDFYFNEVQELKECYIAYFILLYIVSLGRRLTHLHKEGEEFAPL